MLGESHVKTATVAPVGTLAFPTASTNLFCTSVERWVRFQSRVLVAYLTSIVRPAFVTDLMKELVTTLLADILEAKVQLVIVG